MNRSTIIKAAAWFLIGAGSGRFVVKWFADRRSDRPNAVQSSQPEPSDLARLPELTSLLDEVNNRLIAQVDRLETESPRVTEQNVRITGQLNTLEEAITPLVSRVEQISDFGGQVSDFVTNFTVDQEQYHATIAKSQDLLDRVDATWVQVSTMRSTLADEILENKQSIASSAEQLSTGTHSLTDSIDTFQQQVPQITLQREALASVTSQLESTSNDLKDAENTISDHALTLLEPQERLNEAQREFVDGLRKLIGMASVYETTKSELREELAEERDSSERFENRLAKIGEQLTEEQNQHRATSTAFQQLQSELERVNDDLRRARAENVTLKHRVEQLPSTASNNETPAKSDWYLKPQPKTFEELVTNVRREFSESIALPPSAVTTIGELKSVLGVEQLAGRVWQAIGALHEYATMDDKYNGNFYDWCQNSGHAHVYPYAHVAMNESDTTKNTSKKARKSGAQSRTFSVDSGVNPRGESDMFAHVKFGSTGQNRPRLYFYDDTDGETGKIHIGFLGPHTYVQNASSS